VSQAIYPDVTDILARKKEARREISRRSLGEKIAMVEAMRERLAPLKRIREEDMQSLPVVASAGALAREPFPRAALTANLEGMA
jgi:hypothetical protein